MSKKHHTPEQIISKLREAMVHVPAGRFIMGSSSGDSNERRKRGRSEYWWGL